MAKKTLEQVLEHMDEYTKSDYDKVDGFYSGFTRDQYKAAQEATEHWLTMLRQTK